MVKISIREEGRLAGIEEGRQAGLIDGLRAQIGSLARLLNIELNSAKQAHVEKMGPDELQELAETLIRERKWPETRLA